MKYKVGDLVTYYYSSSKEFLGIVTKALEDTSGSMYFVYFFDQKVTFGYSEDALCPISTK